MTAALTHSPFWRRPERDAHREAHPRTLMPREEALERLEGLRQAVRFFVPCQYRAGYTDVIGAPCSHCGHTDFAHGGVHQPDVPAFCMACALLITWLEMNS